MTRWRFDLGSPLRELSWTEYVDAPTRDEAQRLADLRAHEVEESEGIQFDASDVEPADAQPITTRHAHPRAYAIVRRGESAGPLEALPSHAWWSEPRRELSAVAIVVDYGTGRFESEIRAALTVTVLDPSWRAEVDACVELLVLQLAAQADAAELDNPIARRVRELDELEPAPGWVDRAVERATADGLFERRPGTSRPVTGPAGDNPITDEQIRELMARARSATGVHAANAARDCEIALDDGLSQRVRSNARARCAAWIARLGAQR